MDAFNIVRDAIQADRICPYAHQGQILALREGYLRAEEACRRQIERTASLPDPAPRDAKPRKELIRDLTQLGNQCLYWAEVKRKMLPYYPPQDMRQDGG